MINSTEKIAERIKNEESDSYDVYLCKACGHNVCYPFVLHDKCEEGKIEDHGREMVYIATAQDKAEFEAFYYANQVLFNA